jgi:hypothetical protein
VGSNHYSNWSIQHIRYDTQEGAYNQPTYAAEKTLKIKKTIVSRVKGKGHPITGHEGPTGGVEV